MTRLLALFTGNPVTMIYVALAIAAVAGTAGAYSGWTLNGWRLGAELESVKGERDHCKAQAAVVVAAAQACSAGVGEAKRAADASVAASGELAQAARRLKQPAVHTVERIETIIRQPLTPEQAADCSWAWEQIETEARKKAGAAP